ncbi:MAG: S8 family serine peptidase [Chitinophagaceae bacterium]
MDATKPKVKQETEFYYPDKLNQKEKTFTPATDEIVATFQPEATQENALEVMESTALSINRAINLQRGFAVFKVSPQGDLESAGSTLNDQSGVANTLPVMKDVEGNTRFFLPDEFTVQFNEDITDTEAEKIIAYKKATIVQTQRTPGYYTLSVPEGKGLFETIREFSSLDEVMFAEPSEAGFNDALLYIPDDPDFARLWGLNNTGQVVGGIAGTVDADIDAPAAWDYTRGESNVIVAVIDTGADLDHPDLVANFLPRGAEDWDFADAGDSSPDDADIHGTHVAGTVAAVDNSTGVIGVASKCRIMPLRINLTSGMNQNRADAITYVANQAVANPGRRYVINCSWRMSGDHIGVRNAIIYAVTKNVVVVFAAGNTNGGAVTYPAIYPQTIAVANTNNKDVISPSSAVGPEVDVCAPGTNIYSTIPNDTYTYLSGTSMSSPHVAGLAALIWSKNKGLTNAQVRNIIESTCDNINAKNPALIGKIGKGRINAFSALSTTPVPRLDYVIARRFPFPQINNGSSSALAYSRTFPIGSILRPALLFLTQQPLAEKIFYLNPANGALLGTVGPAENLTIGSMEWDGTSIRVANVTTGAGFINSINPFSGAQTASMPVPPGRGEAMAYDGTHIYYSTITRIYKIKLSSGAIVGSFPPPGGDCRSLAYGNGLLFSGNSTTGIITVFNPETMIIHGTFAAPGSGTEKAEGLAYDATNNELFTANQSDNTIYVLRVDL